MKRFLSRVLPLLLSFGLILNCTGCSTVLVLAGKARENSEASSSVISESSASSGVISTPVPTEDGDLRAFYTDVANAESVTVMVYMIGSDLESEDGSATDDLLEMADAALSENVHLVLQTGGTETWWNDVCTDDESERFVIENGDMTLLQSLGSMNMTDADTLSDFIRFSAESYPADRYELILWDHGGGTMTGFGYDELYEDTSLTLSSLSTALYNGGVQFDFIGFDACLMATAEVAYALDPYADYLIASEESEPGEGWAYKNWLTMLAEDPAVPTAELGKKLADDFLEAYIFADMPTLSVLDLRYVPELYAALESYWGSAYTALQSGSYGAFSQVRNNVREFGDNEYDQVDLSDLATLTKQSLSLGTEDDVQAAVQNMVVYNVTYEKSAAGIAVYFPCLWPDYYGDTRFEMTCVGFPESYFEFYDKFMNTMLSGQSLSQSDIDFYSYYDWFDSSEVGGENVTTINDNDFELIDKGDYYALSLSDEAWNLITYIDMTVYLDDGEGYIDLGKDNVYEFDDDGDLKVDFDYTWISIDGVIVPFYAEIEEQTDDYWYTTGYVPAELNGSTDIEIVLRWDSDHDSGFVAGYRLKTEEPTVAAKGLHSFTETDQIQYTCSYYDYDFNYDRDYTLGDPVTYTSEPVVTYEEIGEYRTVIQYTLRDIYNNEHFTDPVELSCE